MLLGLKFNKPGHEIEEWPHRWFLRTQKVLSAKNKADGRRAKREQKAAKKK